MQRRHLHRLVAYLLSVVLACLFVPLHVTAGQTFSRSVSLCPLDVTYADLAAAIGRIREFRQTANRDIERTYVRERLSLAGGTTKLEMSDDFSEASLVRGPQLATDVSYFFEQGHAPISGITLRLGDYSREFTVSGTDRTQVGGLVLLAAEDFAKFGCSLGGFSNRRLGGLGFFLLAAVLGVMASFSGSWSNRVRVTLLVAAISIYLAVLFFPWDQWFLGTVVRPVRITFFERNAPLIGFVATVVGVISIVITPSSLLRCAPSSRQDKN
jgi:hypothetical protein